LVQVHYDAGITSRIGPEPCAGMLIGVGSRRRSARKLFESARHCRGRALEPTSEPIYTLHVLMTFDEDFSRKPI